jgi:hypothetical protein
MKFPLTALFMHHLNVCVAVIVAAVVVYNGCRNRHKLTREAILMPNLSPWKQVFSFADDNSFIELTGFDRETFLRLMSTLFEEEEQDFSFGGRPEILENHAKLGLYLFYVNSTMKLKHLCLIFGVVPSTASQYIAKMRKLVCQKLKKNIYSRIKFPNEGEKRLFADLVNAREPAVNNVIGFIDGLAIPVQCGSDEVSQAMDYNGYHHDTMCNNVFAFAPTGKVIAACLNSPGSWHDSHVCYPLTEHVAENIGDYCFCVDQGFSRSGIMKGKFVGPLSKRARRNLPIEGREDFCN